MKEIHLTPHQKMLSPLELSSELGLVKPIEEIQFNNKIGYFLFGSLITVTAIFIFINWKNHNQEKKTNLIDCSIS